MNSTVSNKLIACFKVQFTFISIKMIYCDNKMRHQTRVLKKSSKSITIILLWKVNILDFSCCNGLDVFFIFLSVCTSFACIPPICSDWVSALKTVSSTHTYVAQNRYICRAVQVWTPHWIEELCFSHLKSHQTHLLPNQVIRPTFLHTRVTLEPPSCKLV